MSSWTSKRANPFSLQKVKLVLGLVGKRGSAPWQHWNVEDNQNVALLVLSVGFKLQNQTLPLWASVNVTPYTQESKSKSRTDPFAMRFRPRLSQANWYDCRVNLNLYLLLLADTCSLKLPNPFPHLLPTSLIPPLHNGRLICKEHSFTCWSEVESLQPVNLKASSAIPFTQ